jgi:hypothetical protein
MDFTMLRSLSSGGANIGMFLKKTPYDTMQITMTLDFFLHPNPPWLGIHPGKNSVDPPGLAILVSQIPALKCRLFSKISQSLNIQPKVPTGSGVSLSLTIRVIVIISSVNRGWFLEKSRVQ